MPTFEITHRSAVIFFISQKHPKNHAYILKNKIIKYFCDHKVRKILYKKINKSADHSTGKILKKYLKNIKKIFAEKLYKVQKKLSKLFLKNY